MGDLRGRLGFAERFTRPPQVTDETACLASWLITLPGWVPWSQWALFLVHLRDIPGVRPAHHHYPESEYELMLMALDPKDVYDVARVEDPDQPMRWLTPPSVVVQFDNGGHDDRAVSLGAAAAEAILHGVLPPEPAGDPGAVSWWRQCVAATADHDREGFHE